MKKTSDEIISILREQISGYDTKTQRSEIGTVLEIGDGIATVYGLDNAGYGELVEFDTGVRGMGLPSSLLNTYPVSCHRSPFSSRNSACRARY